MVVVVNDSIDAIDGGFNMADGGCAGVVNGDTAGTGGDGGLRRVSSRYIVCIWVSMVDVEVVCMLESVVMLAIRSVCTFASLATFWSCICHSSHLSGLCFASHVSLSAFLPCSSPSFIPFLYPSRLPSSKIAVLPFSSVLAIIAFTTSNVCSHPCAMMAS